MQLLIEMRLRSAWEFMGFTRLILVSLWQDGAEKVTIDGPFLEMTSSQGSVHDHDHNFHGKQ